MKPRTILLLAVLAWTAAITAVHAQSLEQQAERAAMADAATTLGGLALGASEASPLGLATLVLKYPLIAYAKTLPQPERDEWLATYSAMWNGAAWNNVCIIGAILTGGALAPMCPFVGIGYTMNSLNESAQRRELDAICENHRAYWKNPALQCNFTLPEREPVLASQIGRISE
jgi:hypothetical protein